MATETTFNNPSTGADKNTARSNAKKSREDLLRDFQTLAADTEKLRQSAAGLASEEMLEMREQLGVYLKRAREALHMTDSSLRDQGMAARERTEEYVHQHPWSSVGIAAGVGFLLGMLVRR